MPNNTYNYPFVASFRDNRTKTAFMLLPSKKICGSDLLLNPKCSVNNERCTNDKYYQPLCVGETVSDCVTEIQFTFSDSPTPVVLDGIEIYFGDSNNVLCKTLMGWKLTLEGTTGTGFAQQVYALFINIFNYKNVTIDGNVVTVKNECLMDCCAKLPYTHTSGVNTVTYNTLSIKLLGLNTNIISTIVNCCVGVVNTPPVELCENDYVTFTLTLNSPGIIEGNMRIFEDCPDINFNPGEVSGGSTIALVGSLWSALVNRGFAGISLDGTTLVWKSLELMRPGCCNTGGNSLPADINVILGEGEGSYTDFTYTISCCPSSCLVGSNPVFRFMFDDFPATTLSFTEVKIAINPMTNCYNFTNLEGYTVTNPSGITANQIAVMFAQILTDNGATGVTVVGGLVKWSESALSTCCALMGGNQPTLHIGTPIGTSYINYSMHADCCTRTEGGGGDDDLCAELGNDKVRWKWLIIDNPLTVYGNNPECDCGQSPPDFNFIAASLAFSCGNVPDSGSFLLYQFNKNLKLIDTGCASSFSNFVDRFMTTFISNPAPDGCLHYSGWFFNAIISYTYVPTTYLGENAYEITFILDKATLQTGCPPICDIGFKFEWGKTNVNVQVPNIVQIENVTCCTVEPPLPTVCPPTETKLPKCSIPCPITDLLYFQFQMPDPFNNWEDNPQYGWKELGDPYFFCTALIYDESGRLLNYPLEAFAVNKFVAQFEDGKTYQQITIDPTYFPNRFYIEFKFKLSDCDYLSFFTEPYQKICCKEALETFVVEGEYLLTGRGSFDCRGYYYGDYVSAQFVGDAPEPYRNIYRIWGTVEEDSISIDMNEVGNNYFKRIVRTTGIRNYRLRTKPIPSYVMDRLTIAMRSKQLKIDGLNFKFTGDIARNNNNGYFWHTDIRLQLMDNCQTLEFTCN